ncbi:unnamed protein product, partial [Cylindrotheca closterium]
MLSSVTHRVRTGFGDSDRTFKPPSVIPFQGCGQGNGAGPPIWISVSSVLITMMEAMGYGFECLSALESQLVTAQCFCFVDDTDVIEAGNTVHHSGEAICALVQEAATLWAGGIRATGGAINPEKSFWWLIDFEWDSRTDNSEHTLGVMLSPLENLEAHKAQLVAKAKDWAEQLRPNLLHKYDVLPPHQVDHHEEIGVSDGANNPGGPAMDRHYGLGLPHPFGCQVFKHLEMLLRHMANRTKTGDYMEASIQAHQLETGTSFGLLQQVYTNTAILASDTWLKRVWHELEGLDIYVAYDSPALSLRCTDDSLLMDLFINLEVEQEELLWLNWCRMFLQTTLSRALLASNGPHYPLQQPLGPWTDRLEDWNWLLSPTTGLFHRHGATLKHFCSEGSHPTSCCYAPGPSLPSCPWWTAPLPADVLRASVHSITGSDRVLLTGTGRASEPSSSSSPSILHAWQTAVELCTDYYGWVPDEIEVHGDEATLADALLHGRLRVISDGSFKNELGTAAVQILVKHGGCHRIIIQCQTPGLPQDQSPYRSELIGLLAGIMAVDWLLEQWFPNISIGP